MTREIPFNISSSNGSDNGSDNNSSYGSSHDSGNNSGNNQAVNGATLSVRSNGGSANGSAGVFSMNSMTIGGILDIAPPAVSLDAMQPPISSFRDLYSLLPAIYRIRDSAQGEQLRALLGIIESELRLLESNIEALYENVFIETCDEWVVPYIGDLLAVRDLNAASPRTFGQERRAYVANTLAYRQRKGTTPVLEQLARDITGWGARAQEMLPLVATTQNVNSVRSQPLITDLRRLQSGEQLGGPFETRVAHTTQISRSHGDRGQYNPTSVALFLWRLRPYLVEGSTPRAVPKLDSEPQAHYFTFNPLGQKPQEQDCIPLFNLPQTETEITTLAQPINVPGKLTRQLLEQWLQNYAPDRWPVQVFVNGQRQFYRVGDLSNWKPDSTDTPSTSIIIIDPERGRLACFTTDPPTQLEVTYVYGFSGDIGAGTYERPDAVTEQPPRPNQATWKVNTTEGENSLVQAVKTWNRFANRWQRCYDLVYLPVAQLLVSELEVERSDRDDLDPNPDLSPTLQPGILHGLQVIAQKGEIEAVVLPGVAVDGQGQAMHLRVRFPILVGCYRNQAVLVLIWRPQWDRNPPWQVLAIPADQADRYPSAQYIRLAQLTIDANGRIDQSSDRVRSPFRPGFSGQFSLSIDRTSEGDGVVSLAASPDAFAVNRDGQKMVLNTATATTVRSRDPQTFLFFLRYDPQAKKGKLDAVPDLERVIIELQGSRTYPRNLGLQIPAERQLYLIASNGDRPHLLGNLRIHGMAAPSTENAGDFFLEGLLVEGGLTVLPGNLQRLQIAHTTLVPQSTGLEVQKAEYEMIDADADDVTLLAILMYSLTILRRLLRVGLSDNGLSTKERISQLSQIVQQQIITLFEGVHYVLQQWRSPPTCKDEMEEDDENPEPPKQGWAALCQEPGQDAINLDEDNSLLIVTIHRSICGTIHLPDTVPELRISESIIDAGSEDFGGKAIHAPGADVTLTATTLLGTITARSLDAENSILRDKADIALRQIGCLRFCYVPEGSRTPRRHRCQPDLLLTQQLGELPTAIATLTKHPDSQQIYAGARGKGVWQFLQPAEIWVPLNFGLSNLNVTALSAIAVMGSGTVVSAAASSRLMGSDTQFTKELQAGDTIHLKNKTYWVLEVLSDTVLQLGTPLSDDLPAGTPFAIDTLLTGTTNGLLFRGSAQLQMGMGSVSGSGDRTTLIGTDTLFTQDILPGDDILLIERTTAVEVQQTRTVIAVTSDTELTIDTPLEGNLSNQLFLVRRRVWTPVLLGGNTRSNDVVNTRINAIVAFLITTEQTTDQTPEQTTDRLIDQTIEQTIDQTPPQKTGLLIGTSGNGIFRSTDGGKSWTEANQGVINWDVRAIAHDPTTGRLLAGTWGNGVLYSTDNGLTWTGGDPLDPEVRQTGLSAPYVTTLFVNPVTQDIFAGTSDGGIFRSTDGGDRWKPTNQGLTRPFITALTGFVQAGSGTISSRLSDITGVDTKFTTELNVGDLLTLNGQNRTILEIRSDTSLRLNDAFDPDLPTGTTFQTSTLFAGSTSGAIFRSTSNGKTWQAIATLTRTDIVGFVVQNQADRTRTMLVGTQIGSFYRSLDGGDRWTTINNGIPGIEQALLLLNQMQPRFTADRYGAPAYAQLSTVCPGEIRTGAEDGSEMGVFNYLKQPQREANLQASLREYLRFGLQTDTIFIT
jgi:hypothetical protein